MHDNGVLYLGGGFENGLLAFEASTLAPIATPAVSGWVGSLTVRDGVLYIGVYLGTPNIPFAITANRRGLQRPGHSPDTAPNGCR